MVFCVITGCFITLSSLGDRFTTVLIFVFVFAAFIIAPAPNILTIAFLRLDVSNFFKQSPNNNRAATASRNPSHPSNILSASPPSPSIISGLLGQPCISDAVNPGIFSSNRPNACDIGFCN